MAAPKNRDKPRKFGEIALKSPMLAVKSQALGVMGISNAGKGFMMKVQPTCSHLPKRNASRIFVINKRIFES